MKKFRGMVAGIGFVVIVVAFFAISKNAQTAIDISEARLFEKAVSYIDSNYIEPDRIEPKKLLESALKQIERTIPEILIKDRGDGVRSVIVGLAEKRFGLGSLDSTSDLKRAMKEILTFIAANYKGETKPEEIEYAAIDGMLEALDPHSNFMPPKVYTEFKVGTKGKFGGLGIVISIKDGYLTVVAPIEDTPAARAGIRAGDRILQINDESTINMSLTDAVNKMRGDVGTKVSIVVERTGKPPKRIALTRAVINIDSVKDKIAEADGKRIGYIKLKSFQENTASDAAAALKKFHAAGAKLDGIILDLRGNPGGLLNVAVDVVNMFLKEGTIVTTVGPHDEVFEKESARGLGAKEMAPMVVLIDEGSASASEIVAGALKANNRAIVMGSQSFGKGSVQTIFDLGEGTALKLTIAQYKPAGTLSIQLAGLTPDIALIPVTVDKKSMNLMEDITPSEGDLEQHLSSSKNDAPEFAARPSYSVRYLKPKEDEKEAEQRSAKEYTGEIDVDKDFAIGLARKLIAKSAAAARTEMIERAGPSVKDASDEQDGKIITALKEQGIDWSKIKSSGEPKLSLTYKLKSKGAVVQRAKAGEKIDLEFTALNTGTGPYVRLLAQGQSEFPFLANREFVFGKLDPGASRSWTANVELPEGMPKEDVLFDISFEEAGGKTPKPITVAIPIDGLPEPAFSVTYKLPEMVKGQAVKKNQSITMSTEITNTGEGRTSADTFATLSNECGDKIFIENGRTKLGNMAPRSVKRSELKFHLIDTPPAECQLKITIADMKRFIFLTKKIDLLAATGELKPPSGEKLSMPTIELASVPAATAEANIQLTGTIKDIDPIRDYYVFVGDKKVAYVPSAGKENTMQMNVTVPLEPGTNTITIGARDMLDLTGKKVIVIDRTSGERKKTKKFRAQELAPGME